MKNLILLVALFAFVGCKKEIIEPRHGCDFKTVTIKKLGVTQIFITLEDYERVELFETMILKSCKGDMIRVENPTPWVNRVSVDGRELILTPNSIYRYQIK